MFSKKIYNLNAGICGIRKKAEKRLFHSLCKKIDFTFDFYLNEDMKVDDFLKKLISKKPHFWSIIKKAIVSSPHVSITYSDRYLNTPLDCILLSQLIKQIRHHFQIHFDSIVLNISRTGFHPNKNSPSSTRIFSNHTQRDRFLRSCMKLLVDTEYIEKDRNIPHRRVLTVRNAECTVEIVLTAALHMDGGYHMKMTN